ncbi:MAG: hypothetical protein V3U06_02260 [Candidatus Binatia bacterium]
MKKAWIIILMGALILSVLGDYLFQGEEGHAAFWNHMWGFFAFFGFIGCVAIIVISKLIGHSWLQRGENYYDHDPDQ